MLHFNCQQMSDVAQGGATVFTELGLSVFPVKGAAAFWLNLHASGEGDFATRHAACPVLQGSKWGTSFKQQTFLTNSTANNKENKKKIRSSASRTQARWAPYHYL